MSHSFTPFSAWRFPGGDLKSLGWQAHGTLDSEILGTGSLEKLATDFLERLYFARRESDTDLVDFLQYALASILASPWPEKRRTGPSPKSLSPLPNPDILTIFLNQVC